MICPEHDTHIDNCVHERHSLHATWEIRVPIRCSSEDVVILAAKIKQLLLDMNRPMVPVNIGEEGE